MSKSQTLLLIDGNSLFHRAYHALPPLTAKSGEMANAVFGFSNMLIKAINEVNPDYIACAFDTKAPTFRHVEFEAYKAQRATPPPDLYPQLPIVKRVLDAFGIKYFEKEGYEADDLIATMTAEVTGPVTTFPPASARSKLKSDGDQRKNVELRAVGIPSSRATRLKQKSMNHEPSTINVIILSGDRDILQLVDGNVKAQMPSFTKVSEGKPGWGVLMGAKEVREKYGLETHQMVDYKSLIGDVSDNVPGISGIGPKTASSLLQKYHTLENLFKHVKETPLKVQEKLEAGEDLALAAKRLVELDRNVDIEFKVDELRFDPDWEKVRSIYQELGFKSIVSKLPGAHSTSEVESGRPQENTSEVSKARNKKADNSNQLELLS